MLSPGARDDFDALCREGCHPHILGLLLKAIRLCPELQAELTAFTGAPKKLDTRARKLEEAAAAIESTFGGLSQDINGLVTGMFTFFAGFTPTKLALELRQTSWVMRLAKIFSKETKARYVTGATGSPHDLHVSGLIAEIRQDAEYNENALRQWRYRHVSEIDAGALGEWRLADFLVALGKVIPHSK